MADMQGHWPLLEHTAAEASSECFLCTYTDRFVQLQAMVHAKVHASALPEPTWQGWLVGLWHR